jgi:hypothetical protein
MGACPGQGRAVPGRPQRQSDSDVLPRRLPVRTRKSFIEIVGSDIPEHADYRSQSPYRLVGRIDQDSK